MGTTVRTTVTVGGCFFGPPTFDTPVISGFGPLPVGIYTYEIYAIYGGGAPEFVSTQPLVVTAAVPTLSYGLMVALVLALGTFGILVLRR